MQRVIKLAIVPLMLASSMGLAACGVTDIPSLSSNPNNPTGPSNPSSPSSTSGLYYEALVPEISSSDFVSTANTEGAKGYRYLTDLVFDNNNQRSIFVRDASRPSVTYKYVAASPTSSTNAAFVELANDQGRTGYRYLQSLGFNDGIKSIFVQENSGGRSTATFMYKADADTNTSDDFITQANAEGEDGYRFLVPFYYAAIQKSYNIYINVTFSSSSSSSKYAYEKKISVNSATSFLQQADEEGGRGYRYVIDLGFGTGDFISLYEKDTSRESTFLYQTAASATTVDGFLKQANEKGATNYFHLPPSVEDDSIYIDLSRCQCDGTYLGVPFSGG